MRLAELLRYVKDNHLEDHFYLNDYGTKTSDVMLYENDDSTYSAFVNGAERGYRAQIRNVSESQACDFCHYWLMRP